MIDSTPVVPTTDPIDNEFAYHQPSSDGLIRVNNIRAEYSKLQRRIVELAPPSRQRSVALTELETSAMWAIKSVVFNDGQSVVAR